MIEQIPENAKVVPGFSGRYWVCPTGVVYSTWGRHEAGTGKRRATGKTHWGYHSLNLTEGMRFHSYMLHRLVAELFVPNPCFKSDANHKDGNKNNNSAENLEWVTRAENCQHAWASGLCEGIRSAGRKSYPQKLNQEKASQIRALRAQGISVAKIAKQFEVSTSMIRMVVLGKSWKEAA